jgi:hypothetical protein
MTSKSVADLSGEGNSLELTAILRFDDLRACFHSFGLGPIRFPMTDWRDVRVGERPC